MAIYPWSHKCMVQECKRKVSERGNAFCDECVRAWKLGQIDGVFAEQQRIIKLLEDEQYHAIVTEPVEIGSGNEPTTSHWATCEACRFIALIKGE